MIAEMTLKQAAAVSAAHNLKTEIELGDAVGWKLQSPAADRVLKREVWAAFDRMHEAINALAAHYRALN